jgi:hypothetical protein
MWRQMSWMLRIRRGGRIPGSSSVHSAILGRLLIIKVSRGIFTRIPDFFQRDILYRLLKTVPLNAIAAHVGGASSQIRFRNSQMISK